MTEALFFINSSRLPYQAPGRDRENPSRGLLTDFNYEHMIITRFEMPRPHRLRRVAQKPAFRRFKPAGARLQEMQTLNLGEDELEALRLADLEGLYQEEAARRMGISRATFARLIARGRATVADALVNGKGLLIGEGPVAPPGETPDPDRCPVHGGRRRRGRRCHCHDHKRGHGAPNAYDEEESLQEIMSAAANEVAQIAAAQGIPLPYADAARRTAEVSRATAANRSSMLQDISRAAPTEIDAISGEIVRFGQRLGIPTPVNEFLLRLIKDKEAGHLSDSSG